MRRKADARWSFSQKKLNELTILQKEILEHASQLLKPGRLCYSTCSIEAEENNLQILNFLSSHSDFTLGEQKQLLPCDKHDGAFAAILLKSL